MDAEQLTKEIGATIGVLKARANVGRAHAEIDDALERLEKQLETAEGLSPVERDMVRERVKVARLRNANERRFGRAGLTAKGAPSPLGEDLNQNRSAGNVNADDEAARTALIRANQTSAMTPSVSPSHPMQVLQSVLDGNAAPAANVDLLQQVRQANEQIPALTKQLEAATDPLEKQRIGEQLAHRKLVVANAQRLGVR